jgi:hypothetical protein
MIMNGIDEAEQLPGASGAEKKAHVLALVATGVSITNATGKSHLDPVAIATIAGHGIDAVVGTVNVVRDAHKAAPILP